MGHLGGYVAASGPVVDLLRQRARPYLFSNALPPAVVGAALVALDIVEGADDLRVRLFDNARYWRAGLEAAGFRLLAGEHPIIPVMIGEAPLAQAFARALDARGVMVSAFFFPVVPRGAARIRTQMNAALSRGGSGFCPRRLCVGRAGGGGAMKALVKAKAEVGLWMEARPVPEIGPEDVLIKVHKTGICGTDIHIWNWDDWAARTVPVGLVTGP